VVPPQLVQNLLPTTQRALPPMAQMLRVPAANTLWTPRLLIPLQQAMSLASASGAVVGIVGLRLMPPVRYTIVYIKDASSFVIDAFLL